MNKLERAELRLMHRQLQRQHTLLKKLYSSQKATVEKRWMDATYRDTETLYALREAIENMDLVITNVAEGLKTAHVPLIRTQPPVINPYL